MQNVLIFSLLSRLLMWCDVAEGAAIEFASDTATDRPPDRPQEGQRRNKNPIEFLLSPQNSVSGVSFPLLPLLGLANHGQGREGGLPIE